MKYVSISIFILLLMMIISSCSGQPASAPEIEEEIVSLPTDLSGASDPGQTNLWGMYEVYVDLENKTANVEYNRHAMYAINLVNILNQEPQSMQVNIVDVQTGAFGTIVYVDVTLIHPYPGMPKFNGYDVRGVLMGDGSGTLAYNSDLKYPLPDWDVSIDGTGAGSANEPDGYTRWFNQPEFSTGGMPMFSYTHGDQATAGYSPGATLCPYQYYADGLGATEDVGDWLKANPGSNGVFSTGSANSRRLAVRFPTSQTKYRFGYAVIANWEGVKPEDHPSNADEAVAANVEFGDGLYYESPDINGGDLVADITLYSWKGLPSSIIIESTVLTSNHTFTPGEMTPIETGENYATWHVEIPADNVLSPDGNEMWVIAEYADSNYKNDFGTTNLAGDDPLAAVFRFDVPVSSPCGMLGWVKKGGGQLTDRGRAIATLSDDSIVVTGEFSQVFPPTSYENIPATFGEGEANETTLIDPKLGDILIARYNTDGTLAWVKRAGGTGYDSGIGITTLADDSIVVTGFFGATSYDGATIATFGEGEPGEVVLEGTSPNGNFFIARYFSDGTLAWAKRAIGEAWYNSENTESGAAVAALSDNSIIATGVFANKAIFGEGEPNETTLTYDPYYWDIFIARYNIDGSLAWAKRVGGSELEKSVAITRLFDDSFVISGWFGTQDVKPATFGKGEPNETTLYTTGMDDIFIAKYTPEGFLLWAKQAGSSKRDCGYSLTGLSDGSVVMSGSYGSGCTGGGCSGTFGEGANEVVLENAGWDDIFLARYDTDGSLMWAKRASGESQEIARGVTTLSGDRIAIGGEFWSPTIFGEGEPNELELIPYPDTDPNFDYGDIFVAWYNPDGTFECATSAGGKSYDNGYAITSLSDDSVSITGDYAGTYGATFGQGEENEVTYYGQGIEFFIARYLK